MKIVAIGDIHGLDVWKTIVSRHNDAKRIIFMGDYFDCSLGQWTIPTPKQLLNFLDILQFKSENKRKVVLLFGNHDFHYTDICVSRYTGYDPIHSYQIKPILHDAINKELLKIAHIEEDYLFSHAGISRTWCRNWNVKPTVTGRFVDTINNFLYYQGKQFEFQSGILNDSYGDEPCQGPLWIRPNSLEKDKISGFIHVVGHTRQEINPEAPNGVIYIDSLLHNQYLIIEDSSPRVETIRQYNVDIQPGFSIITTEHWDKFFERGYLSVKNKLYCQHTGIGYWCKNNKMSGDSIFDLPRLDADSFAWKTIKR